MGNVTWGKKVLAVAVVACLCALIAIPAYAFYYVHSDEGTESSTGQGVIEITCTVDESAIGGSTRAEVVFVPVGGTVADLLNEDIVSSESQNGLEAIHDYSYSNLGDYLADHTYTVSVYAAESQSPGTQTTHDGSGTEGDESTALERFDNVVFTVTA